MNTAPWADGYDWARWWAFARTLEPDHETLARDAAEGRRAAPSNNAMITRFRGCTGDDFAAFVTTLRVRHMAARTKKTDEHWLARFCAFHEWRPLNELSAADVAAFLEHLAVRRQVASTTQHIALNALVFMFREVLGRDLQLDDSFTRAAPRHRIPVVLSHDEIRRLLDRLRGRMRLMYGTGMRVTECVLSRVLDIDFDFSQITVRSGKGGKDRVVPLPKKLAAELQKHQAEVRRVHASDLREGFGGVHLPPALAHKYGAAAGDWRWQCAFPSTRLAVDYAAGVMRHHHVHQTSLQKAIREAARAAAIDKRVTNHTLHHSFATHLLQNGRDIRVIQEMLGHSDVSTTMIHTNVLKKGGLGLQRPLDSL